MIVSSPRPEEPVSESVRAYEGQPEVALPSPVRPAVRILPVPAAGSVARGTAKAVDIETVVIVHEIHAFDPDHASHPALVES